MPATRAVAVFNDTGRSKHFGCRLVTREMLSLMQARGLERVWSTKVGRDWKRYADRVAAIPDLAAVVINGEGTIHHTAERPKARGLLDLAAFAHDRLKVPAFLINATLHEVAQEDAGRLRAFDAIYVRDSQSRRHVEALGVEALTVPDLSLHATFEPIDVARGGYCGTDSVLRPEAADIRRLCRERGWPFWPVSFSSRNLRRQFPSVDRFLPDYLRAAFGMRDEISVMARFLQHHRLLITGRYHAVAYAMLTGTPFLAIESNTPKISSLLEDALGSTERVIPVDKLSGTDLERYARWQPGELEKVEAFAAGARRAAEAMMDQIAARIASWPSSGAAR